MRNRLIILLIVIFLTAPSYILAGIEYSTGIYFGFMPSMGGNLQSYVQRNSLGAENGIEDINRTSDSSDTEKIDRLIGATGGIEFRGIFRDYYLIKLGLNFTKDIYGGEGKTLDLTGDTVEVKYSMFVYDIPVTVGLSIPFWKDVRISLTGGIAYARGTYKNSFKSSTLNSSAKFNNWAVPVVIILCGEHFIDNNLSLMTSINYYKGASEVKKSNSDYARNDFSGFRWNAGVLMYFR